MILKRITISFAISLFIFASFPSLSFAQLGILPVAPECEEAAQDDCLNNCERQVCRLEEGTRICSAEQDAYCEAQCKEEACTDKCKDDVKILRGKSEEDRAISQNLNEVLGCAIKYGLVQLWMFPFFLVQLLEFLVALAGMLCMFFIVLGGYHYIYGGITDEKEKGKKTVMYAIMGFIVVLVSWIVINIIETQLTK